MKPAPILDTMQPSDWPQVREIYLEGLATGQASFETKAPDWKQWDAKYHNHCRLVARQNDRVLGWVALIPASARPCYSGVAELSIYIAHDARGLGLGQRLMRAVVEKSEAMGFWTLYASIFPENQASRSLLVKNGFREIGIRERIAQHHGVWRDTLVLERRSKKVGIS